MAVKKGLGKGMESLLGTKNANSAKAGTSNNSETEKYTVEIDIDNISPNKEQPRKNFDEDALYELAESIKTHGIIEPIVVSKKTDSNGKEYYQIIAGERRWRAAKYAKCKAVPAVIKEYSDKEVLEIALIENIQREDLNAIEEAQAYSTLIKKLNLTQDQLAERVSKSRTSITNSIRLLQLSKKVQQMVIEEKLTMGHVRTLLSIEDKNEQYELAQSIFDKGLSVRETEKLIKDYNKKKTYVTEKNKKIKNEMAYMEKEKEIKNYLRAKVKIEDKGNKGKIVISYDNLEEFERIFELISK